MQKILVIGCGGAGKSTFAKHYAELAQLPLIHLDAHYWQSGWVEPDKAKWQAQVRELLAGERWIMDGNFGNTLPLRVQACDTVIFFDLPRWLCMWRVLKRRIRYHGGTRPDMGAGCNERLDWDFLRWIWNYPKKARPKVLQQLQTVAGQKRVLIVRSQREVDALLKNAK